MSLGWKELPTQLDYNRTSFRPIKQSFVEGELCLVLWFYVNITFCSVPWFDCCKGSPQQFIRDLLLSVANFFKTIICLLFTCFYYLTWMVLICFGMIYFNSVVLFFFFYMCDLQKALMLKKYKSFENDGCMDHVIPQ